MNAIQQQLLVVLQTAMDRLARSTSYPCRLRLRLGIAVSVVNTSCIVILRYFGCVRSYTFVDLMRRADSVFPDTTPRDQKGTLVIGVIPLSHAPCCVGFALSYLCMQPSVAVARSAAMLRSACVQCMPRIHSHVPRETQLRNTEHQSTVVLFLRQLV